MMGGPFFPGSARWIWATVPSIPVVLMLPLTDLSFLMTMVPTPVAADVTAGTSWSPVNLTATSAAFAAEKPPIAKPAARASGANRKVRVLFTVVSHEFTVKRDLTLSGQWKMMRPHQHVPIL